MLIYRYANNRFAYSQHSHKIRRLASHCAKRDMPKPKTILLIGISGSGKGTQAKLLKRSLRPSRHIEIGRLLRKFMRSSTPVWQHVREVLARGDLAPWWVAALVWLSELSGHFKKGEHLIFDGSPRTIKDARLIDEVMADLGRPLPTALLVRVSEKEARRRLIKRRRFDDNLQAIRRRFNFFRREVFPVINYYRRRGRLIVVNGDPAVPAVWRDIKKAVGLR